MKIFFGQCPNERCHFIWSVEGRMPNYCPECACTLFHSFEQLLIAKKNCVEIEHTYINPLNTQTYDK